MQKPTVSINEGQRLFVISTGSGYSTLGFDVAFEDLTAMARHLGLEAPNKSEVGTLQQYEQYTKAISALRENPPKTTWFRDSVPRPVRTLLERYRKSGEPLRLFFGDPKTGRDWLEENDVIGTIGRSMGPMKVPLLITDGGYGGGAILCSNIIRIVDVRSRKTLWLCRNYSPTTFLIREQENPERPWATVDNGDPSTILAAFSTYGEAAAWVAFMTGNSMDYPCLSADEAPSPSF